MHQQYNNGSFPDGTAIQRYIFNAPFTFLDHLYFTGKKNLLNCCIFKTTSNHNLIDNLPKTSSITDHRAEPSVSSDTTDHNVRH